MGIGDKHAIGDLVQHSGKAGTLCIQVSSVECQKLVMRDVTALDRFSKFFSVDVSFPGL